MPDSCRPLLLVMLPIGLQHSNWHLAEATVCIDLGNLTQSACDFPALAATQDTWHLGTSMCTQIFAYKELGSQKTCITQRILQIQHRRHALLCP